MDRHPQVQTRGYRNIRNVTVTTKPKLSILHENIQSIGNKQIEVHLALKSDLKDIDVLCFTEHWLKEDCLKLIHIDQYKLVSYCSRTQHNHGGSCIYVVKNVCTKNLNCFQDISAEKDFEVSATELVDYNYIIVCIYRSHDDNFLIFLKNHEFILHTIQSRNKKPFLCGDWNLNFLVDNKKLQELQILLESYNMMNIVRSPTRITPSTVSLIDVIITNKDSPILSTAVIDLGFSDHHAQLVRIDTGKRNWSTKTIVRRQFTYNSIAEFKHLLSKEVWNDVYNCSDVNSSLEAFLDTFLHCFNIAFPLKKVNLRDWPNKIWLSNGLIVSSERLQTLNNLKRTVTLTDEALVYIANYQRIYERVLKEAKERENDRYVIESANRPKAMWRLINREIGNAPKNEQKLELKVGNKIISNPAEITDKLKSHFINTVKEMVKHNNNGSVNDLELTRPNSIFIYPVTDEEVISLTKSLKGKPTSGVDDVPENLVKQYIHLIKGPLSHLRCIPRFMENS
jgi:hypothetical protein